MRRTIPSRTRRRRMTSSETASSKIFVCQIFWRETGCASRHGKSSRTDFHAEGIERQHHGHHRTKRPTRQQAKPPPVGFKPVVIEKVSWQTPAPADQKARQQQADFLFDKRVHALRFFKRSEATKISSSDSDSQRNSSGERDFNFCQQRLAVAVGQNFHFAPGLLHVQRAGQIKLHRWLRRTARGFFGNGRARRRLPSSAVRGPAR